MKNRINNIINIFLALSIMIWLVSSVINPILYLFNHESGLIDNAGLYSFILMVGLGTTNKVLNYKKSGKTLKERVTKVFNRQERLKRKEKKEKDCGCKR